MIEIHDLELENLCVEPDDVLFDSIDAAAIADIAVTETLRHIQYKVSITSADIIDYSRVIAIRTSLFYSVLKKQSPGVSPATAVGLIRAFFAKAIEECHMDWDEAVIEFRKTNYEEDSKH